MPLTNVVEANDFKSYWAFLAASMIKVLLIFKSM